MRVIFLDIDGVLNSGRSVTATGSCYLLDSVAVGLINKLCEEADAKIVVSSTWRKRVGPGIKDSLAVAGIKRRYFHPDYATPEIDGMARGAEVKAWLLQHDDVENFVCIDDNGGFFDGQTLIQTNPQEGFSYANYCEALHHLAGKTPGVILL